MDSQCFCEIRVEQGWIGLTCDVQQRCNGKADALVVAGSENICSQTKLLTYERCRSFIGSPIRSADKGFVGS